MPVEAVTTELLVRYLDTWLPAALHASRRATFVQTWPETVDVAGASQVLRVFGEFGDRTRGRRVTVVFIAPDVEDAAERLPGVPADCAVHLLAGPAQTHVAAAMRAAQGSGAPVLACLAARGDPLPAVRAAAAGKPAEVLLFTPTGGDPLRDGLADAGFGLACSVDLVAPDAEVTVTFATRLGRSIEAFKSELWQLDEYAGVRIRDPRDAGADLIDISLHPNPGPLRREILAHLRSNGPATVTELRRFALTGTAFRASDATAVLQSLLAAGTVTRTPLTGRLGGDTRIAAR